MVAILDDILAGRRSQLAADELILKTAEWAAFTLARFDQARVERIAGAVADAGCAKAPEFAGHAVRLGGGLLADKTRRNQSALRATLERFQNRDFCAVRIDGTGRVIELPRPAGVILALLPHGDPVAAIFSLAMLAIRTRNAIVVSPANSAETIAVQVVRVLAEAAESAGAPVGAIQVIDRSSPSAIEELAQSNLVSLVIDAAGSDATRLARARYSAAAESGAGAIPALVDASADCEAAAGKIVQSKSFDRCADGDAESVILAEESIADRLLKALARAGGYCARGDEVGRLRESLFGDGAEPLAWRGRSAAQIARRARIRVPNQTGILVAPIDRVGRDEPFAMAQHAPIIGFARVPSFEHGVAVVRDFMGTKRNGRRAVIHSRLIDHVMAFAMSIRVSHVWVGCPGASGLLIGSDVACSFGEPGELRCDIAGGILLDPVHLLRTTRIFCPSGFNLSQLGGANRGRLSVTRAATGREAPVSFGRFQEGAPPRIEPR